MRCIRLIQFHGHDGDLTLATFWNTLRGLRAIVKITRMLAALMAWVVCEPGCYAR